MAVSTHGRSIKKSPFGFFAKVSLVVLLGLSFVVVWSTFLSPFSSLSTQRSSFGDIESAKENKKGSVARTNSPHVSSTTSASNFPDPLKKGTEMNEGKTEKKEIAEGDHGSNMSSDDGIQTGDNKESMKVEENEAKDTTNEPELTGERDKEEEKEYIEEVNDREDKIGQDINGDVNVSTEDDTQEGADGKRGNSKNGNNRVSGPLFDPKAHYNWKSCSGKSGYNYIPCVDLEGTGSGKLRSHRHHDRSCPVAPPMCLIPLPQGYESPIPWPESKYKIFYRNVAHPKLSAFERKQSWLKLLDNYLSFPGNESIFSGGAVRYLDSIQEMAPDIDWGKNIRVVLDIASTDASFGFSLLEKDVLTLSLGMMSDQTDLAQLYLERGMPAVLGSLGKRKLPFPYGVFDAVHCGECNIPWHSNGGKILLEINRMLRPGGYFLVSFRHGDIEGEEGAGSRYSPAWCLFRGAT